MNKDTQLSSPVIKAVIFDLGRVLVDVDLTRGIFRHFEKLRRSGDLILMENLFSEQTFLTYLRGKISPQQFHRVLADRFELPIDYPTFEREWCDVFQPMDGMDQLFEKVRQNYKVGLLSDIGPLHWRHLRTVLPILKLIPRPVLSFETGFIKPEPACYETAAESVQEAVTDCLFIDDRPVNVQGARELGMQALQFHSPDQLRTDLNRLGLL